VIRRRNLAVEERIFDYLASHYNRFSSQQQNRALDSIIARLASKEILKKQIALDIVKGLEEEENYSMAKVIAHLDMLDLEDRI
jgi:hypothetical protein